jgi:hypothetical protein
MSRAVDIEVDTKDFLRKLSRLEPEAYKAIGKATRPIVAKVRDEVRGQMPRRDGDARKQIQSGFDQRGAYVRMNKTSGDGAPYVAWLDFGGTLRPTGRRFNTIRRSKVGADGRYLYPTAKAHDSDTKAAIERAWDHVVADVGLN